MKRILILPLLLITITSVGQTRIWTLNECMQYAVENSPKVKENKAQNSIYHQNYMEAIGRLLPRVSASTNAYFNFGRSVDDGTNGYTDVNSFSNNYSLNGSLTLFDGLANISRIKMGKANKLMGKEQVQQEKDMIAYETFQAYANVIYYKEMVALAQEQLDESNHSLKQIERMEELGVKGFPDVAEIRAKQAADTYNLTKQENLLAIGIILLKEKMNYPLEDELDVDEKELDNDPLTADNNLPAYEIYNRAIEYLPKALSSSFSVKASQMSYRAAKGELSPTISIDGGWSTNFSRFMDGSEYTSFKDQFTNRRGYYVGFTLSIPIFTGFSRSANVKRSKAEMTIAKLKHDQTLVELYSEIEQAVTDLKGLAAEYYQAKAQVEAIQVAHDVNQKKYNEGLISMLELHTSANRLLKAKSDELNSKLMHEVKRKMVNYYKGVPFITE